MTRNTSRPTFDSIWGKPTGTMTAQTDIERILVDGARLPLAYWRSNFFFMGGLNRTLSTLTRGQFPAKADPDGTHPVFALHPVAGGAGFAACPCSTSGRNSLKWVNRNTKLLHTGYLMERTSYILDRIRFNIPASEASKLRFKGEVPQSAIQTIPQTGSQR